MMQVHEIISYQYHNSTTNFVFERLSVLMISIYKSDPVLQVDTQRVHREIHSSSTAVVDCKMRIPLTPASIMSVPGTSALSYEIALLP